jgi:hypothetical protein
MSDEEARIEDERRAEWAAFERRSARTLFLRLPSDPGPYVHLRGAWAAHSENLRQVKRPDGTTRLVRDLVLLQAWIIEDGRCPGCGRPLLP